MPGTRAGGKRAARTNRKRYGEDFYARMGAKGGSTKTTKLKGFAANPQLAIICGKMGGSKSKRGKAGTQGDGGL